MRSNSGKDESRNNMRDPTIRDRTIKRDEALGSLTHLARESAGRPSRRPQGLTNPIISRRRGPGRASAPAFRPSPASRALFRRRASPRPRKRCATRCRRGPDPRRLPRHRSGVSRPPVTCHSGKSVGQKVTNVVRRSVNDYSDPGSAASPRDHSRGRCAALRSTHHSADDRPARNRHSDGFGWLAEPHSQGARSGCPGLGRNRRRCRAFKVAAVLGPGGAVAPKRAAILVSPRVEAGQIAVLVGASIGDYRSGDEIWCDTLAAEDYGRALNRDVLIPRPAAQFMFGRLIDHNEEKAADPPARCRRPPQVVANPPWLGLAVKLVRNL